MKAGWRDAPLTVRDLAEAIASYELREVAYSAPMGAPWPSCPYPSYLHNLTLPSHSTTTVHQQEPAP